MGKMYFSTDVNQCSELLKNKRMSPLLFEDGGMGLIFTEDRAYWISKIEEQLDLDNILDYRYAIIIEIEMESTLINSMIEDENVGRLSDRINEYYQVINRSSAVKILSPEETNILCILDVYESNETEDGLSQSWMLKVTDENNELWKRFSENISKISIVGGIPEAEKEVVDMLTRV